MNNRILAKVGAFTIMESEVNEMVATLRSRGQNYDHPQGRAAILEQLIANKLLLTEAQKNLYEHNAAFKAQLEKVKEDLLISFAAAKVLDEVKPDVVLVHGDTSTTFVTALACFYKQIAVGHIEAGLRTYNIYSP